MPQRQPSPAGPAGKGGKNLGDFTGHWHHGLAAHFQAAATAYSRAQYDPVARFLPSRIWLWVPHVLRYKFGRKHPFRDYSSGRHGNGITRMPDRATVSLVGDWGTGTDEAGQVARSLLRSNPEFTIHLGDVYFVGDGNEIRENMLGVRTGYYDPLTWPMGSMGSFALGGNHEWYANGKGYFDELLPRMGLRKADSAWGSGQWASFFCLENDHWRLIGLDTAYNSTGFDWGRLPLLDHSRPLRLGDHFKPNCRLPDPLLQWVAATLRPAADNRGLVLLTHHGPYSGFGEWYPTAGRQLRPFINRPVLWFWGHEHKLAIYDQTTPRDSITSYGRCMGHGGMPVERGRLPDPDSVPGACRCLAWDNRRYHNEEKINVGVNGFVELRFQGDALHIAYRDLQHRLLFTEDWRVNLETGDLRGPHLKKILDDPSLHFRTVAAQGHSTRASAIP